MTSYLNEHSSKEEYLHSTEWYLQQQVRWFWQNYTLYFWSQNILEKLCLKHHHTMIASIFYSNWSDIWIQLLYNIIQGFLRILSFEIDYRCSFHLLYLDISWLVLWDSIVSVTSNMFIPSLFPSLNLWLYFIDNLNNGIIC